MPTREMADFLRSRRDRIQPEAIGLAADGRRRVWYAFCDLRSRSFYVEWERMARQGIAHLRAATGHDPGNPATLALIEELTERSPHFRRWWHWQDVKGPGIGRKEFRHPVVGRLSLDYVGMLLPGAVDQQLVTYTAVAGSPSPAALDELARRIPAG